MLGALVSMCPAKPAKYQCSLMLLILLAGCSTAPAALDSLRPGSHLGVLQLPTSVDDRELTSVLHSERKDVPAIALGEDRMALQQATAAALTKAFTQSPSPILVSAEFISVPSGWPDMSIGQQLDAAILARLQAQHPADAYLRLRVTDYGQTPDAWKGAYVTFEVVSTVAIGGLLYIHRSTRALAGVYLAEEGVEEYVEGYAGWQLLNRLSRPVRIEADLIDGSSGAVLWRGSDTGLAGWQWGHLWHMDDATRRVLLQISTDKATRQLTDAVGGSQPP